MASQQLWSQAKDYASSAKYLPLSELTTIFLYGTAATFTLLSTYVIYQVYFHPLAKYPGPFLAKLTRLHNVYRCWRGDRHLYVHWLHEKYGPVIRTAPNELLFNTPTALHQIYGFGTNFAKGPFYDPFSKPSINTHNTRVRAIHSRKRKVMSNAFSNAAMKEMELYVQKHVHNFIDVIRPENDENAMVSQDLSDVKWRQNVVPLEKEKHEGWSQPRNMANWFSYLTMDVLGELCFGKDFSLLTKPDNRYTIELVANAGRRSYICGQLPLLHYTGLANYIFRSIHQQRIAFLAYSRARLSERTAIGDSTGRKDFFHYLLNANVEGQSYTDKELWAESSLLLIAGSDTTSTSLSATMFYLTRYPRCLRKATSEVRAAFSSPSEIVGGPALNSCVYLRACIEEAMRLSPAVGGALPRVTTAPVTIDGHAIPVGTTVGVPIYAIHHNRLCHIAPFSFVPERWISGATWDSGKVTTPEEVKATNAAFSPFSIGPRGCIGRGMAYAEMVTTLANLLWVYDIRIAEGILYDPGEGNISKGLGRTNEAEYQMMDVFTSKTPNSPIVQIRHRRDIEH